MPLEQRSRLAVARLDRALEE
jgi:hypothetical protein